MACFVVPAVEAVVTTTAAKIVKKNEVKNGTDNTGEITLSEKMGWLNKMLWGGSGLLAFEHLWNGEIAPFFPFLTKASDPLSAAEMLTEMATTGTAMAALVTCAWAGLVLVTGRLRRKSAQSDLSPSEASGS